MSTAINVYEKPVGWRYDQATNEGDWLTAFSEWGEPMPSATVRNVTPLFSRPPQDNNGEALSRALEFIESLMVEPLLVGLDDIEMTLEDVQAHATIELASIRRLLSSVESTHPHRHFTDAISEVDAALREDISDNAATRSEVEALKAATKAFSRLLLPIHMLLAEQELIGEPLADDAVLFNFMGSGASDHSTVGEYREAMRLAESALLKASPSQSSSEER